MSNLILPAQRDIIDIPVGGPGDPLNSPNHIDSHRIAKNELQALSDRTDASLADLSDAVGRPSPPLGFQVVRTTAQSIPNNQNTLVTFDGVVVDTNAGWQPATSRYRIPLGGWYLFNFVFAYVAGNNTGNRIAYIGGAASAAVSVSAVVDGFGRTSLGAGPQHFNLGDELWCLAFQNAGTPQDSSTGLAVTFSGLCLATDPTVRDSATPRSPDVFEGQAGD